jgi:cytochrome c-type biogenesis protein CcsB
MTRLLLSALFVLTALPSAPAAANPQTAPQGNEKPETRMISPSGPAAEPPAAKALTTAPGTTADIDAKAAFARAVNLAPLRGLAVYHNGRVKVIDTLARETIGHITGRKTYQDFRPRDNGAGSTKVTYDPLFTLLDMTFDPGYYETRPFIAINYNPLRDAYLDAMATDPQLGPVIAAAERRESYFRIGRVPPLVIERYRAQVRQESNLEPFVKDFGKSIDAVELFRHSVGNLLMVAPDSTGKEWDHLSVLAPDSPAGKALGDLARGWRSADAARVNTALASLAVELPKIHPDVYPDFRRTVELAYNRSNAFEWGYWLYAGSLVSLLLAFGTQRPWLRWTGITFLAAAAGIHLFGFAARCFIAERFAIQNQFESMTGVSLFAAVFGLGLAVFKRQLIFGAAVAAVGFLVLITATQTGIPGYTIEREAAILNTSVLLKYHVTTVLLSYGLISLGFVVSLFYLWSHYANQWRGVRKAAAQGAPAPTKAKPGLFPSPVPALAVATGSTEVAVSAALGVGGGGSVGPGGPAATDDRPATPGLARLLFDLDRAQMTVLQLAFWTLGVGILLGAWWADHSWGRWWAFDPKELWALVTWICYLVVVHMRFSAVKDKGLVTAWLSVIGFFTMLWCYFGVNLWLPGLHAYA